jgi:hypothetical protein
VVEVGLQPGLGRTQLVQRVGRAEARRHAQHDLAQVQLRPGLLAQLHQAQAGSGRESGIGRPHQHQLAAADGFAARVGLDQVGVAAQQLTRRRQAQVQQ